MLQRLNVEWISPPREQGGFSEMDTDECHRCFVFNEAFMVMESFNGVVADAPGVGTRRINHGVVQA
ncbi:hypothetical protein D3C87_1661970 [compost metagenome]